MNLPNQSAPVIRSGNAGFNTQSVDPSCGAACTACKIACSALPGFLQGACKAACGAL